MYFCDAFINRAVLVLFYTVLVRVLYIHVCFNVCSTSYSVLLFYNVVSYFVYILCCLCRCICVAFLLYVVNCCKALLSSCYI